MRGPRSHRLGLFGLLALVLLAALFVAPGRAFAHAALVSSNPANGSSVTAPDTISLTFSKTFTVPAPGIQLLDGKGAVVPATLRVQDKTATLTPEQPLGVGGYGVRWTVKAPDSHPRSGSLTFTVTGASTGAPEAAPAVAGKQLAAALSRPSSTPFTLIGNVGQFLILSGAALIIGALALAFFVARATAREAGRLVLTARRSALLVALGTLLTVFSQVALFAGPGIPWPWKFSAWTSAFGSMWGLSVVCLLGGAVAFLRVPGPTFAKTDTWMRTPVMAGGPDLPTEPPSDPFVAGRLDWRTSYPVLAAVAALLLGIAFNGHSQSSSPLVLAWLADIVHVLAAGVWSGGVVLLLGLIARRRRAKNPALTADAVLRFSLVATVASIAAGITGLVLAVIELPSVGALFGSTFGRILLVKIAVVAAIAALGAYHHFRVLPALSADPSAAQAAATWKLLRLEAIGFVVVMVLTAFLVNASYS